MSRPRFLADEDLRGSIIRAVRRMEPAIEFTTVVEQGVSSAADEEVLDFAWRDRWLLVSHDVNTIGVTWMARSRSAALPSWRG